MVDCSANCNCDNDTVSLFGTSDAGGGGNVNCGDVGNGDILLLRGDNGNDA
jgi:hypothetical protein